jgi:hypothetical protein
MLSNFLHIYTFIAWTNSVDPDQLAYPYRLKRMYTVGFFISLVIFYQNATSADPDQMAQMSWLIWIYTVGIAYKCIYIERKMLRTCLVKITAKNNASETIDPQISSI